MRVAAYHRMSAPDIEQMTSTELLMRSYEERINRCRRYKCVGCYFDEGDSRAGFEKLMPLIFTCSPVASLNVMR